MRRGLRSQNRQLAAQRPVAISCCKTIDGKDFSCCPQSCIGSGRGSIWTAQSEHNSEVASCPICDSPLTTAFRHKSWKPKKAFERQRRPTGDHFGMPIWPDRSARRPVGLFNDDRARRHTFARLTFIRERSCNRFGEPR